MRTCLITNNNYLRDDIKAVFETNFKEQELYITSDSDIAKSLISKTPTDLVIVDIDAEEDPIDMINQAKFTNPLCGIIAFSQSNEEVSRFIASHKDINDYLTFPFTCKSITDILENAFKKLSSDKAYDNCHEQELSSVNEEAELILEERISGVFISIGIAPNISGYAYLKEGVKIAIRDPLSINHITKIIYPQVAERFDSSPSKVERSMRHAISTAWNRGKIDNLNNFLGIRIYSELDRPTNGEFIALIADKLLLEGA